MMRALGFAARELGRTVLAGSCAAALPCAVYAEHEALVDLRSLSVIRGSLPGRAMGLVLEWANDHRDELLENWNLCRQMQTPKPIEQR